ncbi:unnamed protein product [Clonostachys chloroleuca]|uniref:Uncharacterized protein n=1 Tax=Clonostachys chloroleuca TaxID=1926264 RepID=A0AA35LWM5_9HYPO|nr:unnamed protein product [Clonostachys chloroleuca]
MAPTRPTSQLGFEITIICALTIKADAIDLLFDQCWDNEYSFSKAPSNPNAYTTSSIGRYNIVLAYIPGTGKANTAVITARYQTSYPNIKLALIVDTGTEIILGDIIISNSVI